MSSIYIEVFLYGLAIALSPITIIAVILMLLTPHGRSTGLAFLMGWVAGLVVVIEVFLQLANPAGVRAERDESAAWVDPARIVLGCLLLLLALYRWRLQTTDTEPVLPSWTRLIDRLTPWLALVLGAFWAGPSPKNAVLLSAASASIAEADLSAQKEILAVIVIVIAASIGVAVPVIWALYAGDRASGQLAGWREWLLRNNAAITSGVLAAIAVILIGKGVF